MSRLGKLALWVFVTFVAIGAGCFTYGALELNPLAGAAAAALSLYALAKLVDAAVTATWRDER